MTFTPPEAFALVSPGVYRSNIPNFINYSYLKTLDLQTAIILSPELPTRSMLNFLEDRSIKMHHLGMEGWKSNWRPITEEIAKTGLEILLDTTQHPVIVMCATGIHETGILIGCLRKLIGWNFNAIIFEYRIFAGNKSRMANEQFIELFDIDLVSIPLLKVPKWYTTYLAIDT